MEEGAAEREKKQELRKSEDKCAEVSPRFVRYMKFQ
jgi:hypothetical protein